MAREWANSQRDGWLCQLYGKDNKTGVRVLPPDSIQSHVLGVLEGLVSQEIAPKEAAVRTASLIMAQDDVETPWSNHVGMHLDAAQVFENEEILKRLVDYLIELASLPDAINEGPEAKTVRTSLGIDRFEPGQPIKIDGRQLWRDLPVYSITLTESFQGPEQYLKIHGGSKEPLAAMQAWKNLNTYIALVAVHPNGPSIPVLANHVRMGVTALAIALEQPSNSQLGRNSALHAPAAAQWLRIAGHEIEKICTEGTVQHWPGDLWEDCGGDEACNNARLAFWKSRLDDMGY